MTVQDITAIGLMSGTSMDGVDAALLVTDGRDVVRPGAAVSIPYAPEFRTRLRDLVDGAGDRDRVRLDLTRRHADAVRQVLAAGGLAPGDVDVIGFHGHTISHAPERGMTDQLGDGALLAELTGIDVVHDLRGADVAAGGQGAPLAPVYHRALLAGTALPVAVLNVGGVANVTWIGSGEGELLGFDTGPGNGLIDDWVRSRTGADFDEDGRMAARGRVDEALVARFMREPYLALPPPKSLDRNTFAVQASALTDGVSPEDGAATLTAITAAAAARAREHLPSFPGTWVVVGGGRRNPTLMKELRRRLGVRVVPGEVVGLDGDGLEAQAFAYLAVRSLLGLPISYPGVTGVPEPMTGGVLAKAAAEVRQAGGTAS